MSVHFLDGPGVVEAGRSRIPISVSHLADQAVLDGLAELILTKEERLKRDHKEAMVGGAGAIADSLTGRYYAYNLLEWDAPCVRSLQRFFLDSYFELLSQVPLMSRRNSYIQCWANTVRYQEYIEPHNHGGPDSFYSGNLAVRVQGHESSFTHFRFGGTPLADCLRHSIVNRPGTLTIFPSYLDHFTEPWPHQEPRITIAFDIVMAEVANRQSTYRVGRRYIPFDRVP